MKIALCQVCKGRLKQALQTVPHNLEVLKAFRNEIRKRNGPMAPRGVEFVLVIVDHDCPEESYRVLGEGNFVSVMNGTLLMVRLVQPEEFRIAVASNLAHRVGIGLGADYLVNLDIDNFISKVELYMIAALAAEGAGYHGFSGWSNGTCGRIGLPTGKFLEMNGYREDFPSAGGYDVDLVKLLGKWIPVHRIPAVLKPIWNSKEETIKHTTTLSVSEYRKEMGNLGKIWKQPRPEMKKKEVVMCERGVEVRKLI